MSLIIMILNVNLKTINQIMIDYSNLGYYAVINKKNKYKLFRFKLYF